MRKIAMLTCILLIIAIMLPAVAVPSGSSDTAPKLKDGKKWRIGYYESGSFASYSLTFGNIIQALTKMGWLEETGNCPYKEDSRAIWTWLGTHNSSKYIEFVKDAYYSFDNDTSRHEATKADLIKRLNEQKDIDLMIVMGTVAGQDLAQSSLSVPVMIFSTSDAVKAGIIASSEDSGRDNVWAHVEPYRYKRQVELFHDIFRFKKLGLVYENSVAGKSYVAFEDLADLAEERGFELVSVYVDERVSDSDEYHKNLTEAYRKLSEEVDAVYLTLHTKQQLTKLPDVLAPLTEKKIPTFTQMSREVQYGALMAVVMSNFEYVSAFDAGAIVKVLNGASPRSLVQTFVSPPNISLNLAVADHIGYAPSFPILLTADTVYQQIAEEPK